MFTLMRPFLHRLPPEVAHNLGLWVLRHGLLPSAPAEFFPSLEIQTLGMRFANPIGLAAGFDKNAIAMNALLGQGFGFIEAGTVTPEPQPGNPKPRIFRLREDAAIINRLGFNNNGLQPFVEHFKQRDKSKGIAGANIGRNKNSTDAVADYVKGLQAVYPYADYITVNISSPNTQGLRALQGREALTELLAALQLARRDCMKMHGGNVPLLLKIAPDLSDSEMEDVAEIVLAHGIDGVIVSNTTISRPSHLQSRYCGETGGLSGKPLLEFSTERLKHFYRLTGGKLPLIGVGGISNAQDAYMKIRSGATLVQCYTVLAYEGFSVVNDIRRGLEALLARDGLTHIQQAVGIDA